MQEMQEVPAQEMQETPIRETPSQEVREPLREAQRSGAEAKTRSPDAAGRKDRDETEKFIVQSSKFKERSFADAQDDGGGREPDGGEFKDRSSKFKERSFADAQDDGGGRDEEVKVGLNELISGDPELKREYDETVRRIINKRFKANRENDARLRRMDELMPRISRRYGTPDGDLDALADAVGRDEEKSRADALRERRGRAALYAKWDREIPEAEARFPGFDMKREMSDPRFARIAVSVGVVEAYEAVHRRELDSALVEIARRDAAAEIAGSVAANISRPSEGGLARTAAPLVKVDPRSLTREERLEVRRRLKRGEKVRF